MKILFMILVINKLILLSNCSNKWSAKFIKKAARITDQSWKIYSAPGSQFSKFWCLNKCRDNIYCAYVEHGNAKCIFYSEYAKDSLISSNDAYLYEKISYKIEIQKCSQSDNYWSLSQKKCLSCLSGFTKYAGWPYACYQLLSGKYRFASAKLECQNKGTSLITPKSRRELDFIEETFGISGIWVYSSVSSATEVYKWSDGMRVGGFMPGQPSHSAGNMATLSEPFLGVLEGGLNDYPPMMHLKNGIIGISSKNLFIK
ncbi:hypothetical protein BpHYR1_021237 [Brachionus plicatilis]|uniref:C-type lectin domain-containing protein n=1 Tax=Brachionus plicatilis TaxID=10195 RepID=A0A3M7T549_BRAPC|nr:hypothetical protein BpHYR1_021237 [Brachionus plicatilis]